jgi:hypothetical protein
MEQVTIYEFCCFNNLPNEGSENLSPDEIMDTIVSNFSWGGLIVSSVYHIKEWHLKTQYLFHQPNYGIKLYGEVSYERLTRNHPEGSSAENLSDHIQRIVRENTLCPGFFISSEANLYIVDNRYSSNLFAREGRRL